MINASALSQHVTIGGVDVSAAVISCESRDTDNEQGLITQQGRMVLGAYEGSALDFNDRTNPDFWQVGQSIVIQVAASNTSLTVFKTLRILNASYDSTTKLQTLDIGCKLKLLDYPVVRDCEVKGLDVVLGGSKTKTAFINDVLDYFGLSAIVGSVPGAIGYPVIGESDSLAQVMGRIAYSEGRSLWVDQQENIQVLSRRLSGVY